VQVPSSQQKQIAGMRLSGLLSMPVTGITWRVRTVFWLVSNMISPLI